MKNSELRISKTHGCRTMRDVKGANFAKLLSTKMLEFGREICLYIFHVKSVDSYRQSARKASIFAKNC